MQKRDCKIMRCLGIERKEQRPDESLIAILHLPMQNCPKTESRIWSTPTAPMTSPTARNASLTSTATYSGGNPWPSAVRAQSHDSNARRRQSRCRVLIATVLSGLRFCFVIRARISFCSSGRPSPVAPSVAQNAPLIGGGEQRIDLLANRIEPPAQRFTFIRCDPFLRKINRRVDVGEQRN